MSNTLPKDRVQIFKRDGTQIAEFRAPVNRSWVIAGEGRAQFTYPARKTDVVNETVLQFGNWILVQNTYLQDWVGVLDVPRSWESRSVTVSAYTPERIFSWRRGADGERLVQRVSGGALFEEMIKLVNQHAPTILRNGEIWKGGKNRSNTFSSRTLDKDLGELVETTGHEYQFRPAIDTNGKLIVYCDWKEKIGEDTSVTLQEGKGGGNVDGSGNILVEDGPIYNDIFGYGSGETWNSRPMERVVDWESIHKYDLRQIGEEHDTEESTTVLNNIEQTLYKSKQPVRIFSLKALNTGETFYYMRLGNQLRAQLQNMGFYAGSVGAVATVRIVGMTYDPLKRNELELVLEEIL